MGNSHKNLLLRNHWANCNKTLVEWSLDGPLPKCVRWSWLPTKMATKLKIERRFLCEFPIGSYVKLSSAVGVILVEGPNRRTHIWKRTIQWLFHQNFVLLIIILKSKQIITANMLFFQNKEFVKYALKMKYTF
jgi:hypothetical protein